MGKLPIKPAKAPRSPIKSVSRNRIAASLPRCIPMETITPSSRFRSATIIRMVAKIPNAITIYNMAFINIPPARSASIIDTSSGCSFLHDITINGGFIFFSR